MRGYDDSALVGRGDPGEGGREGGREEGGREGGREGEDGESLMSVHMFLLWLMSLTPEVRYSG